MTEGESGLKREQLMILHQKLAPWLKLSLLTLGALGAFLFSAFLFRQIVS